MNLMVSLVDCLLLRLALVLVGTMFLLTTFDTAGVIGVLLIATASYVQPLAK